MCRSVFRTCLTAMWSPDVEASSRGQQLPPLRSPMASMVLRWNWAKSMATVGHLRHYILRNVPAWRRRWKTNRNWHWAQGRTCRGMWLSQFDSSSGNHGFFFSKLRFSPHRFVLLVSLEAWTTSMDRLIHSASTFSSPRTSPRSAYRRLRSAKDVSALPSDGTNIAFLYGLRICF